MPLVLLQCFAEAQGVTILPPSYSWGDHLGQALGQGLQQGMQQAAQAEFIRQQYIQDQKIIQSYNQQLLDLLVQQQQNNDLQELHQKLNYWQHQTENDWAKEFEIEISRTDAMGILENMDQITSLSSFSGKDPSIQMLASIILINPNRQTLFYKCCPYDRLENPKEFAYELLLDAAKKNYVYAKKAMVIFYNEQGDIENTMNWLYSLAVDGSAEAMRLLALKYGSDKGFYKNEAEMIKWILLASSRGDLPASYYENFITKWFSKSPSYIEGKKRALDWNRQFPKYKY